MLVKSVKGWFVGLIFSFQWGPLVWGGSAKDTFLSAEGREEGQGLNLCPRRTRRATEKVKGKTFHRRATKDHEKHLNVF